MSAREAELVITRKRKRQVQAIDPCLGFYCNISSLAAPRTPVVIAKNADNEDATDHPGWTSLPQDPPSKNELDHSIDTTPEPCDLSSEPEPQALTVEAFLQRGALGRERIHVRKYGRKYRNRRIIQSDDEWAEDDRPDEQLDDSRPALRLLPVPVQRPNKSLAKPKPRAIRLWNTANAKGVPFRTSSFSESTKTKKELFHGSTGVHPLSTWSTFRRPNHRNEAIHRPMKVSSNRKHSTRCAPLAFVPLVDAEEAYNKKFHSARFLFSSVKVLKDPSDVLILSTIKREELPSFGHGQEPQCTAIAPLILVPTDHTKVSLNQSCSPLSPNAPSANLPAPDSILEPALEVPDLPLTVDLGLTQVSPSCSKKTSSDKRLKPLGTFLEGFLERVRAATQAEDALASCSQHKASTLESAESQESLVTSEPIPNHGLEQTHDRTPGFSCSDGARRPRHDQPSTCSNAHPEYLHATTRRVDQSKCISLDILDDTIPEEFPPYIPPSAPFDINAALLAYTQVDNSCIQL